MLVKCLNCGAEYISSYTIPSANSGASPVLLAWCRYCSPEWEHA